MGDKVLDRFPLTADGWAQAWAAVVGLDAGAAQAVAERVQELLAADAVQTAEMERQAQVYEAFENAGRVTVFRRLGVQVLVGDGKVFTIGSHNATTKTDSSRLLGPLAGAEAWVDADNGEGFDGYDVTASLAKLMRPGGSPLPGTQAQGTSTVLCANGEKHQTKVYGFTSALRRVQREVAAFNAMVAAPSGGAEPGPTRQTANRCQTWVSTVGLILGSGTFRLVRLAGFEPATRCLEG
jgi:hypothetical protein